MQNFITVDGRKIAFRSGVDPVREAERTLTVFDPERTDLLVLFGLTTTEFLSGLFARAKRRLFVLCVDPDTQMRDILAASPGGDALASGKDLFFFDFTSVEKIRHRIEHIFYREQNAPFRHQIIRNPNLAAAFRDRYAAVETAVAETVKTLYNNLLVINKFRTTWLTNIRKNVASALKPGARIWSLKGLADLHRGQPAIIVCAGPSLDGSIGFLKGMHDKYIVICVDTALGPMLKNGVRPDYVVSLDCQIDNLRDFTGLDTTGLNLVMEVSAHYKIAEIFKGDIFLFHTKKMLADPEKGLQTEFVEPHYRLFSDRFSNSEGLQSGGSVSTTALDLALFLGCSTVRFLGQDLAFSGFRTYCKGTYQEAVLSPRTSRFRNLDTIVASYILNQVIKRRLIRDGIPVLSTFVMESYREWFEEAALLLKNRLYFHDSGSLTSNSPSDPPVAAKKGLVVRSIFTENREFDFRTVLKAAISYLGDYLSEKADN